MIDMRVPLQRIILSAKIKIVNKKGRRFMKILAIGDVCGRPGVDILRSKLHHLKKTTGADLVIVNGEMPAAGEYLLSLPMIFFRRMPML